MKKLLKILAFIVTINAVFAILPQQIFAQQEDESSQEFYNQLSPYGRWVNDPSYGNVWYPSVGQDFTPYLTNGNWVNTEFGWTWVSNYEWGWAPFHYGRWDYDNLNNWFWVPDNEWAPAWVLWRRAEGYYGWTAMRPGYTINGNYNLPHENWIFVKDNDIDRRDLAKIFVSRRNNSLIYTNSAFIDRVYRDRTRQEAYFAGPSAEDVRRTIGREVKVVKILERDKPGHNYANNQFQLYRPLMHRLESEPVRSSAIENFRDERRASEREIERDRQQKIQQQRENKNARDLTHSVNNLIKTITGGNTDHNKPDNNTNRGQQPSSGNQNNSQNSGRQRNPGQPNTNTNASTGQQPSSGNQNNSQNSGRQKNPVQPNNSTSKGQQPSSGNQNSALNSGQRSNANQPNNANKPQQQPVNTILKGNINSAPPQQKNPNTSKNDSKDNKTKQDKKDDKKEK